MSLEEFLANFDTYSARGGDYKVLCPAHDDKNPSLSVTEREGRLLLFCHAGCPTDAVLEALGMTYADIGGNGHGEPEAVYTYTDEHGNVLFEALRYAGKKFRQRRREPETGEIVWNLDGVRRVLYRLPEVLQAARIGKAVWITEGEKDADSLRKLGFIATTGGSAGKWRDEYTEALKGSYALVACDCDKPGRTHANAVAASLHEAGIPVKVIDLDPQRDDGYDVSDFLGEHNGTSLHLLRHKATVAPRWQPGQESRPPIMSVKNFAAVVPPYDENKDYLGPFLHGGYRIHVAGPTGHGKTSFLLEAEGAALRGDEFLAWAGRGSSLRALHVDLEMPAELLLQAVKDARLDTVEGFDLMHLPDGLAIDTNDEHRKMLERAVQGYHIVVLDPWMALIEHEMEYSHVSRAVRFLNGLRKRNPDMCLLLGCHTHEPYTAKDDLRIASIRGFKRLHDPADVVLTFQRMHGDTSRVRWLKNRSPKLDVKIDEVWTLDWTRGEGFTRVHEAGDAHIPGVFS